MFWAKEKKLQVELINPRLVVESQPLLSSPGAVKPAAIVAPTSVSLSLDDSLKLAAVVAAVVNACLIIFGYMRYLAMLELYGIGRSEISFSVADLLAYGYGSTLNMAFATRVTQIVFGGLSGLVGLGVILLLWRRAPSWKQTLAAWGVGCVIAYLPMAPIFISYLPAKRLQLAVAAEHLGVDVDKLDGLTKRTEVLTSDGWMQGDILLVTNDFTYLLVDAVVYKIRQADGAVVRKTHLSAQMKSLKAAN